MLHIDCSDFLNQKCESKGIKSIKQPAGFRFATPARLYLRAKTALNKAADFSQNGFKNNPRLRIFVGMATYTARKRE